MTERDRIGLHRALERREEIGRAASRSPMSAGPTLVPFSGWPWPVKCLSVTNTLSGGKRQGRALEAADRGQAHLAHQIGVLAVGLLDPAPARIARRRRRPAPAPAIAPRARISRAATEKTRSDQVRVPGAGEGDRLREAGRAARDIAVQRLLVHQDRDAEPRVLDRPMLRGIDIFGGLARVAIDGRAAAPAAPFDGGDAALVGRTGDPPMPFGKSLRRALGREAAVGGLDLRLCSQTVSAARPSRRASCARAGPRRAVRTGWRGSL